jgi:hypothetical protein
VVALLALPVVFGGWLVREATRDSSLQAEGDYYRKALDWDRQQANRRRLGWQVHTPPMPAAGGRWELTVRDGAGLALQGATIRGQTVHVSMGSASLTIRALEAGPGRYFVLLPPQPHGWHHVQLDVSHASGSMTWSQRVQAVP